LRTGVKRRRAEALVLWFVVVRSDGVIANGRGGIGAATVECVGAFASGGGACDGDEAVGVVEVVAAVSGGVGIDDASGVAFGAAAVGADSAVGIDDVGCLVGFAIVVVSVGVGGAGSVGDAGRAVGVGVVAASVAICSGGVEGAGGVDEAGDVVGGVAAVAIAVDIAGVCGTDGAGVVDDVCVAVAVVVGGVIFVVKVQSRVSGREVGAEEASVGGRAQGAGRYEIASAETSGEAAVTARAGMLSEVFVIVDGLDGCVCAVRVSGKGVG